jgi:hypothetical protein
MRRVRTLGLVALAVFALAAVTSATATAALPEWLINSEFITSGGASTLETTTGTKVTCTDSTASGKVTVPKRSLYRKWFTKAAKKGSTTAGRLGQKLASS